MLAVPGWMQGHRKWSQLGGDVQLSAVGAWFGLFFPLFPRATLLQKTPPVLAYE